MDHDPNQPESSSSGEQPPLSQQSSSQDEQLQEPPLYESAPQWRQQPLPQYQHPTDGPPQYGYWPPQPPKKRSLLWLWITLALVGGLIALCCIGSAIFVALRIGSFVRHTGPFTCLPAEVPTSGSSIGSPARQAEPVTTLNDSGPGSLRQAIAMAPFGSTITFDPSLRGTILLTSGDLNITNCLTIRGPGAGILSISGGKSGHIVRVQGFSVTISGLTFKDSTTSDGFIINQGMLTLSNSTVSGNTATGQDGTGGILNGGGMLTLNNSTVSGNTGTGASGGIFNVGGTITLNNSTVSGNTLTNPNSAGGGIFNNGGTLTLNNSTVSGNTVTSSGSIGGGIYNNGGTLTLTDSTVSGNIGGNGGGIDNNSGTFTLSNSTISDNRATNGDGGGIDDNGGTFTLSNSTISDNKATGNGGGIAIANLQTSSIGGVPVPVMLYCTVYGNTAGIGGGIWVGNLTQGQAMTMGASIVAGNKAHTDPDFAGSLASLGYNLFQDTSGATFDPATSKQHGTDKTLSVNDLAKLFAASVGLRNNGGPTRTYALAPDSPAVDQIPLDACHVTVPSISNFLGTPTAQYTITTDQRGMKRPDGNEQFCDIGAYEYVD